MTLGRHSSAWVARFLAAGTLLTLSLVVQADLASTLPSSASADLTPVPELDISGAEPRAQEAIQGARHNLDALLADPQSSAADLAEAYGRLGAYYHVYSIRTGAELCYRNAIALAPTAYRWRHLLAFLTYSSGRYDETLTLIDEARRIDPANPSLNLYEGATLLGLNRTKEAEPLLHKAFAQEGLKAAAAFRLGQIALQRRAFDEAIGYFETALTADPAANAVYFPLAQALRGAGRNDEAKAALAKRGKEAPHVGDLIAEQLDELDQGSRPLYLSGLAAAHQGDYEAAAEAFGKGLQNDADNYRARSTYARALYLSGHKAEAGQELERVEAVAPAEDPLASFLLGVLDNAAGRTPEARARFEKVLKAIPDHSGALYFIGLLDFNAGDYAAAAERLDAALKAEPGNHYAQVLALVARHRQGSEVQNPVEVLSSFVETAPTQFLPRYALIRLLAAAENTEMRDTERALAMADALVADQPIPPALEALALARAAAGDFASAEQALDEARSGYFFAGRYSEMDRLEHEIELLKNGQLPATAWPMDDPFLQPPVINPRMPFLEYPSARAY